MFIEDTAWYKLNDSVMSRNHRDRKLTKVQRHIKSGHIGFIPNCPVCMQTSATRRVSENAVEKVDQKPGRTWSADSIYHVDCDSYQGNRYTIVMYNGATGYMSLAFMELRSTAAAKIETAVQRLRDDPRYKSVDQMVEILQCDPAGEWHRKNVEFMSVMKKLRIHFIMRATNADKREMAEGEGAVKIAELLAKRIMLESRLEAEMWQYAYVHAAWMKNLHTRAKDAAPDGDGIRPIEALSNGLVSREQCNRYIHYGVVPGKTLLATVMRGSGSSVTRLANTRWASAVEMNGENVVCRCPFKPRGAQFETKNFVAINTPGMSTFEFLRLPQPGTMPSSAAPAIN